MILVTGARGNVGGYLCEALKRRNIPFVGGVRSASTVNDRTLNFLDPATFDEALAGIERVFLVRPPALSKPEQDMRPFLDACRRHHVNQVVFLSLQGAEKNPWTPHAKIEKLIVQIELPYTFLRPSFFMQNLTMQHRDEIRDRHELFVPAGDGRTNFIDARDIAEAAAISLTESGHVGRAYELTGTEAYTYDEVAQFLSKTLARPIHYRRPGLLRYIWRSWRLGQPLGYAVVTAVIYTVARRGKADGYSDELSHLLQRPPQTLPAFIEEHRHLWFTTSTTR